jgi:hypothetical protein
MAPPSRGALGLYADEEAGVVDQMDHRQMERLGEVDKARHLLRRVGSPAAAVADG